MHEIVDRIMLLAAPKKKAAPKYQRDAENAYDELLSHLVDGSDYTKNDRAFRLMMRIKKALEAEGYAFREKVMRTSPSSSTPPKGQSVGNTKNLVCSGSLCTLLKSKPHAGLDADTIITLTKYFNSKQCYEFSVKPSSVEQTRKNGTNVSLPKPLTWAKLENFGLTRENIITKEGHCILEEFTIDGITAYTSDRQTFFVSNAGMCRRWFDGLDRISGQALSR